MDGPPAELLTTARSLATDAACVEVVRAWREQGIESILLKGATTAEWLYPHAPRGYSDADLLVAPSRALDAAAALSGLGFVPARAHVSDHAHPWIRATDDATVDLHVTVWGPSRDPEWVWRELQDWVAPFQLGGDTVRALDLPARALHVTLHAAQHRDAPRRPDDLRRLLDHATLEHWRGAERLADRLWALLPMSYGLALEPAGERVLEQLPLVRAAAIGEREGARLAVGFARLHAASGARAKAAVLATTVRSATEEMTSHPGLPRRRGARLVAYLRRTAWLLGQAPATALSLRHGRPRPRAAAEPDRQGPGEGPGSNPGSDPRR